MRVQVYLVLAALLLNADVVLPHEGAGSGDSSLGFTLGLSEYQVKERVLNNIRHRGMFVSGGLLYESSKPLSTYRLEIEFIYSGLKSRYDPETSSIVVHPGLSFRYAKLAKRIDENSDFLVGGMAGAYSHIAFYENWDESHFYWLTSYHVGIAAIFNHRPSPGRTLQVEIALPALAAVSRPHSRILYKEVNPTFSQILNRLHDDIELATINKNLALDLRIRYVFKLPDKFGQSIHYRFRYIRNRMAYSKEITILNHSLGVSLLF